jgi:xylose isomerase
MPLCARAPLVIDDDALAGQLCKRYYGWEGRLGKGILAGKNALDDPAALVDSSDL